MTYSQTLDWMFAQLPMYQRQGQTAFKKDLTNIKLFVEHLKHPEKNFKSIHIAGTNGKGSVSNMLASIFQEAGYKTGLYTSPHLKDFRERIRIDGEMISEKEVVDFIANNQDFLNLQQLSFFEMTVGMAFEYFSDQQVDIAIIETGLGGRLDSTNIINPEISVITNIGLDHTAMLGETHAEIAFEKAGIIKAKTPVIIGQKTEMTSSIFKTKAEEMQAPLLFAEDKNYATYETDLKGSYQKQNIQTVLCAIEKLQELNWKISIENIKNGLANVQRNVGFQGRWQQLGSNPKIICDTGHNKEGLTFVLEQLQKESFQKLHIVLGVVNDKNLESVLPLFPKDAIYYFCQANVPRALSAEILREEADKYNLKGEAYPTVKQALNAAKNQASPEDLIFVGGSTFTVAEII